MNIPKHTDMLTYDIHRHIEQNPNISDYELCNVFKVSASRIMRRTRYLEVNGWVTCRQDSKGRGKLYCVTDKVMDKPIEKPVNEIEISIIQTDGGYTVEIRQNRELSHTGEFDQYDESLSVVNRVWDGEPLGSLGFRPNDTKTHGKIVSKMVFGRTNPLVME